MKVASVARSLKRVNEECMNAYSELVAIANSLTQLCGASLETRASRFVMQALEHAFQQYGSPVSATQV